MDKYKKVDKLIMKYLLMLIAVVFVILNHKMIFSWLGNLFTVLSPIFFGAVLAYILNILMEFFERHYFPNREEKWVNNTRRPISILLSIVVIILVLFFVMRLVIPQLLSVFEQTLTILPTLAENFRLWVIRNEELFPPISDFVSQWNFDWQNIVQRTLNFVNDVTGSFINTAFSTVTSAFSIIVNLFLSLMIAVYILFSKEKLSKNFNQVFETYLSSKNNRRLHYVLSVFDESFRNFITGEVIEAAILGMMMTVGMLIFQFPYATMIGALTGVTAIIPILGAYLSGAVGFLLILMNSPIQALFFIIFIVVVQQIEGNLIYPRVVGSSIGLPGLWVLIAVTIGGGVGGIGGMLVAVPLASALYRMLKDDVKKRHDIQNTRHQTTEEYQKIIH
ncbi:AI-2E family transporter [Aerococcaceae bacterium DSM 111020]|nr:AI-2E family transporter [Aerococcaceae bacterium DSM 111020]